MKKIPKEWSEYFDANMMLRGRHKSHEVDYNFPLFTCIYMMLCKRLGYIYSPNYRLSFMKTYFYNDLKKGGHQSHDNATGLMCALVDNGYKSPIDVFDRKRAHPRDIVMYAYGKLRFTPWRFLIWPLLIIPSIAMIISCFQDTKTRGDVTMLKTDGKLLAWARCLAFDMKWTMKICTWAIESDKDFNSWYQVADMYYGKEHPTTKMMYMWCLKNKRSTKIMYLKS